MDIPAKAPFIAAVFLLPLSLSALGTVVQWVALRLARVPITAVTFFYGRPLVRFSLFGDPVVIGCIPTGTSVGFDVPRFAGKSLFVRLCVVLSSSATLFAIAAAFLGFSSACHHFASGFSQLIEGALHPRTTAFALISQLQVVYAASFFKTVGIVACKLTASSLLPLGGMTTVQIIGQSFDPHNEQRTFVFFSTASALSAIALMLCWLVAVVFYVVA